MANRMALAMALAMTGRMAEPMRSGWQNDAPNPNPNPNPVTQVSLLALVCLIGLLQVQIVAVVDARGSRRFGFGDF